MTFYQCMFVNRLVQTKLYRFCFRNSGILLSFFLFFFVLLYLRGALINAHYVNIHIGDVDQSAYLNESKDMVQSNYKSFYTMGRARMPIFGSFLTLVYDSNFDQFFKKGKYLNIFLSIIYTFVLLFIFKRYLNWFMAVNLLLIVMFTVFIYRAPYVQPEITYYLLFFIDFLLLSILLLHPSIKFGIVTGVILGITHLTKASVIPLILIFAFFFLANQVLSIIKRKFRWRPLASFGLLIFFFLLSIAPYILHSKRIFGSYFYNVSTTLYAWCDSWNEANPIGGIWEPILIPKELTPGPQKYFKEHTLKQIIKRLDYGKEFILAITFRNNENTNNMNYGYHKYISIFFAFLLFSIALNNKYLHKLPKKTIYLTLFVLTVVTSYSILVFWYTSIAPGNRFILTIFLPTIFSLAFAINKFYILSELTRLKYVYFLFNILLFCFLCYDIYITSTVKIFYINGAP